jgi:hypothetical protein
MRPTAKEWQSVAEADIGQGMVLTVDWARHTACQGRTAASTSTGHLAIMQVIVSCVHPHHRATAEHPGTEVSQTPSTQLPLRQLRAP